MKNTEKWSNIRERVKLLSVLSNFSESLHFRFSSRLWKSPGPGLNPEKKFGSDI